MKCPQLQSHSANQLFAFDAGTYTACISGADELSTAVNNAATGASMWRAESSFTYSDDESRFLGKFHDHGIWKFLANVCAGKRVLQGLDRRDTLIGTRECQSTSRSSYSTDCVDSHRQNRRISDANITGLALSNANKGVIV